MGLVEDLKQIEFELREVELQLAELEIKRKELSRARGPAVQALLDHPVVKGLILRSEDEAYQRGYDQGRAEGSAVTQSTDPIEALGRKFHEEDMRRLAFHVPSSKK